MKLIPLSEPATRRIEIQFFAAGRWFNHDSFNTIEDAKTYMNAKLKLMSEDIRYRIVEILETPLFVTREQF